jgi:hypothetical protein
MTDLDFNRFNDRPVFTVSEEKIKTLILKAKTAEYFKKASRGWAIVLSFLITFDGIPVISELLKSWGDWGIFVRCILVFLFGWFLLPIFFYLTNLHFIDSIKDNLILTSKSDYYWATLIYACFWLTISYFIFPHYGWTGLMILVSILNSGAYFTRIKEALLQDFFTSIG